MNRSLPLSSVLYGNTSYGVLRDLKSEKDLPNLLSLDQLTKQDFISNFFLHERLQSFLKSKVFAFSWNPSIEFEKILFLAHFYTAKAIKDSVLVKLLNSTLLYHFVLECSTGIPQFTLLMWRHKKKTAEAKTA